MRLSRCESTLKVAFVLFLFSIRPVSVAGPKLCNSRFIHCLWVLLPPDLPVVETCLMPDEDFFAERADQSEVKARIVSKYFPSWARIIAPRSVHTDGKVAYIDLFCGPGRYEDGSASTPLLLLSEALKIPQLRDGLVSIFNDADEKHTNTLEKEIARLPNIGDLKHKPEVYVGSVDGSAAEFFEKTKLIPTFSFIDPFGYKGLSWSLIRAIIKDWASECVFFFNYSRINAGVSNDLVLGHMQALFGEDNLAELRKKLAHPHVNREATIMKHLVAAMKDAGAKFVLPFRFRSRTGKRTTHYLVFVTKHQVGYEIMKEIMAVESSQFEQGVPSFEYSPAVAGLGTLFPRALDDLEDDLVVKLKGRTVSMQEIYHEHNVDRPYIKRNYKDALGNLDRDGRITTDKPERRVGTFADNIRVTFPAAPVARKRK